ncbi:Salutaridine reductase [Linum perenne]
MEIVKQLAGSNGIITVVLTARDVKRGTDATKSLHQIGFRNVVFHQLDVLDSLSIRNLVEFLDVKFGVLDILVNNAGASEVAVNEERLRNLKIDAKTWLSGKAAHLVQDVVKHTYEKAEECLNTNFYGVKATTEALLPLLKLSTHGARIVNISSLRGELQRIPSNDVRNELGNIEALNETKLDAILKRFLEDCKDDNLEAGGWPLMLPAYSISKAAVNAYTRILAKRYLQMKINCVHPGFVSTDLNYRMGTMTVEEGARGPVKCALLPDDGPSGCYFDQTEVSSF